jgi:hypothetical protein
MMFPFGRTESQQDQVTQSRMVISELIVGIVQLLSN